jgi:actin-related protein 8
MQPGSNVLRIGRATDAEPTLVPHVLARLVKGEDSSVRKFEDTAAGEKERERELLEVQRGLQRFSGPSRKSVSASGGAAVDTVEEEVLDAPDDSFEFLGPPQEGKPTLPQVVCGEAALRVCCAANPDTGLRYVEYRPMQRGRLQPRRSIEAMYNDLEILWRHAMTDVLEIPKEEIPQLACILIVPANVCKTDVKTMVHVLLSRMRLACVSVLQDAACASFQANTSTACIVDIGDTKTSVSCVEDGKTHSQKSFIQQLQIQHMLGH